MVFRNRLLAPAIALVVVAITVFGCQIRDGSLPTEADRSLAAADQASDIYAMIAALIKDKGVGNSVNSQFKNVVKKYAKNPADGRTAALATMDFIFKHYREGKWSDPGGLGTGELIAAIAAYVGLIPEAEAAAACLPGVDCEVHAPPDFGGAMIQGDMVTQPFILYLLKLPDDFADPPRYPFFYEIGTIPAGITFPPASPSGSLSLASVDDQPFAAVCALDSADPIGTPPGAVPGSNLFLSHFEGGEWVTLPFVEPPTGFVDCSGAASETESALWLKPFEYAASLLSPPSLHAGGRGLGGAISSFSPFGAELTSGIPTTTTLSVLTGGPVLHPGDTITLHVVVSPTPPDDETGVFILTRQVEAVGSSPIAIEDGVAEQTFTCGSLQIMVGKSYTGEAFYTGSSTHDPSSSGQTVSFSCQAAPE